MQRTIIIAGMSGLGISTFIEKHSRLKINDYSSIDPIVYEDAITEIKSLVKKNVKFIFVNVDVTFLKLLEAADLEFYIVMPCNDRKTEFLQSLHYRRVYDEGHSLAEAKQMVK